VYIKPKTEQSEEEEGEEGTPDATRTFPANSGGRL
jgi:hypothetical protein